MQPSALALQYPAWHAAAAVALGAAGVYLLLPRPRGRQVAAGVFLCLAGLVIAGVFAAHAFAGPGGDRLEDKVYAGLFWLFASVAVTFAGVMIAQRNPARGAMAFAVSVLATCGLFLLLAAPFLMAATVVVYAGATIVTFLFVLMLSHAGGPSDENDRTREPLLGSLGGLGFAGLVLFTLYLGSPARATPDYPLPAAAITAEDETVLRLAAVGLRDAARAEASVMADSARGELARLGEVVGYAPGETPPAEPGARGPIQARLRFAETDARTAAVIAQADTLRADKKAARDALAGPADAARAKLVAVADGADLLRGRGELPARNVAAVGYALYSEHLLAVELAGTLLLVATVGAVATVGRRRPA